MDLLGNDFYLAHVYRTLHWWSRPTHVTVLGDLIGSQWVSDGEFESRGKRFWERVFNGGERVGDEVGNGEEFEVLGGSEWEKRIINIAGNHDIGYAGDISAARVERFERMFGRADWDVRFRLQLPNITGNESTPVPEPTIHLINLNSLTLDTPALDTNIQSASYAYLNDLIMQRSYPVEDRASFTLLLTHLPLHKEEGICTDGPDFTFFEDDDDEGPDDIPRFKEGGLKEQNHLSDHVSSNGILQGIFGMTGNQDAPGRGLGRNGLILNGHDHTGCDVVHYVNRSVALDSEDGDTAQAQEESWRWSARRYTSALSAEEKGEGDDKTPSLREVTLRSMMGEFGGNAGLLSLWFDADPDVYEWKYEISMCMLGVQHIWWAVHVIDLVTLGVLLVYLILPSSSRESKREKVGMQKQVNGEKKHSTQPNGHTKTETKMETAKK